MLWTFGSFLQKGIQLIKSKAIMRQSFLQMINVVMTALGLTPVSTMDLHYTEHELTGNIHTKIQCYFQEEWFLSFI